MQQIATDSSKPIDVFGTVYEMRMERCHMVQNEVGIALMASEV